MHLMEVHDADRKDCWNVEGALLKNFVRLWTITPSTCSQDVTCSPLDAFL